jgi:hypothetical protein
MATHIYEAQQDTHAEEERTKRGAGKCVHDGICLAIEDAGDKTGESRTVVSGQEREEM